MPLLSTFGAASARSFGGIGAAAAGAGLDINEAFSAYLYEGTGSAQTITNGVDLSGEGGLVWMKSRTGTDEHTLMDTVRGIGKSLISHETYAEQDTNNNFITSFNSNGFSLGTLGQVNRSGQDFVSWTFRKAPKFFDVVTYTGNFTAGKTVSHNLGSVPGMILIKRTDNTSNWIVYHRSIGEGKFVKLNSTDAEVSNTYNFNNTAPTSTQFTLGESTNTNTNGATYVAYLFAHNDGDGGFGPDGDQDVIKCGSFTEVSGSDVKVNLGFEPQWIIIKVTSTTGGWGMYDVMRGWTSGSDDFALSANTANAESNVGDRWLIHPDGFTWKNTGNTRDIIYMAIRRGPLAEPESATDVFGVNYAYTYDAAGNTGGSSAQLVGYIGKPADLNIQGYRSGSSFNAAVYDRLRNNKYLITNTTSAEASVSGNFWDNMAGFREVASAQDTTMISWTWKRAPGYFDVVAFSGDSTSGRTVSHNLGVAPELMIVKRRTGGGASWTTYVSDLGATKYLRVNNTNAVATSSGFWNNTAPTSSVFTVGNDADVNGSGEDYIAYLFATVAGVSKVGSFTGTAATQTIDCGFSSGARFVLIKETNTTGGWMVFDTVRGIVSGNDARLELDDTGAESTSFDILDPHSSGFQLPSSSFVNASGRECIFYAIA